MKAITITLVIFVLGIIGYNIYLMNENSEISYNNEKLEHYVGMLESYETEVEIMLDSCYEYNEYIETVEYLEIKNKVDSIRNTFNKE